MSRFALVAAVLGLVLIHAADGAAQTSVRGAVGIVHQVGIFGDDNPRSTSNKSLTFGVETRRAPEERAGFAFDMTVPTRVLINPHIDERLFSVYLLAGGEFGRRTFARILGGAALGLFTGSQAESPLELMPAAGFSLGHHIDVGMHTRVTPEVVARGAIRWGVASWMMGLQVAVSPKP